MQEWMAFAKELAQESGELIMRYYTDHLRGAGPEVITKPDDSPVTAADREAEMLMRERISKRFPDHAVLGEEFGRTGPTDAALQWVLDPIDGTKAFVHGVPLFGTLIALMEGPQPILGVIHLPATGELMIGARGQGTTVNGRPVRVRDTAKLEDATFLFTDGSHMHRLGRGAEFVALQKRVRIVRGWGDCYGHFMVAAGRADIMVDPELSLWDVAALKPCVEEAGGRLTELSGSNPPTGSSAVSTNGALHDEVIAVLNGRTDGNR